MWPSLMLSCQSTCSISPGLQGSSKQTAINDCLQVVVCTDKCMMLVDHPSRSAACHPEQMHSWRASNTLSSGLPASQDI